MPKPVPVKIIRFRQPTDGGGFSVASSLTNSREGRATRYTMNYLPWVRHHRIEFTPSDKTAKVLTTYVHESEVMSWVPEEGQDVLWEERPDAAPRKIQKAS